MQQTVNGVTTNYVLDLNAGLTQVLSDGTSQYLYGNGRIGEYAAGQWTYYATDALGSVRQIVDASGDVIFYHCYAPYGEVRTNTGIANLLSWDTWGRGSNAAPPQLTPR